ncbi:MAG: UDP-N-acetylmuramoyl-L-alanyl-D-glutamate--2,6-diaminopimelate ligase [Acidobacteria bacterium]|nr:UDP-N-acetylmuramoyl-L-alanyl-D-glutamate--2,6-diaminopimelate ligase [Acidobacteriota bacterium]MCG2814520.1 UDP-N-acetylmuramoyl-L-alanyl-D-glutamate--2,6-diaminopimelate ligase [Candidatus Aminicenantes bacterium]MBU1338114.1 UDP-N-acetylmuramoyl-L-alanyl-D-glutamate--2,6-diaminopimelate ligase [Acidobacteriota bacterium]MBU1473476.1 UDP-N-acetylmuramoyl-L-alanyl-D-glutamate--2,6-diaminopimelate ligase [Acidobacteriota bacterium]MBU4254709.1 UDP-N-acetylmuramoyl-L-alanyl-D-glutamate--2,6-
MRMTLKDITAGIPCIGIQGRSDIVIAGITYASGKVKKDDLFAALKGEKTDGNLHVPEAIERGAAAVLSDREKPQGSNVCWIQARDPREAMALAAANFYRHPSRELKVVGVTGTKGKTTITYLLESIFRADGKYPGVIGTISYRGPGFERTARRTTPEAPDLQAMLRIMADNGGTHAVIEVSSHSLDFKRVYGIGFDVAVFTNLSGEHLDYHRTMDAYFESKETLFRLGDKNRMAVINTDDAWGQKLSERLAGGVISFGLDKSAIVRAEDCSFTEEGLQMRLRYPAGSTILRSPLLGKPNIYNILAAVSVALTLNTPLPRILEGIKNLPGVPGRFQSIPNSRNLSIFVDYAHTDDALLNLLETARGLNPNRVILVFGAGGDRDRSKRARMGEAAGRFADWSIITNDNPRSEDPRAIIDDIRQGIEKTGGGRYAVIPDRRDAIAEALSMGREGDCILIAGKGHENYQIIGENVSPFDDAEVVHEILKKGGPVQ